MYKKNKQAGFYIIETLLSFLLFSIVCVTLLPIQYQLLLEKKRIYEEDKAIYFLMNQMHEAIMQPDVPSDKTYDNVISSPLTISWKQTNDLLEGCVSWANVKQQKTTTCLYGKQK
ncbi:type II secretion system GspH family protein [Gracilibacillus caseinilyticus]|uniref:Type II secretion system GspH family protein n=1 Tax=Gracilibacillus caseinilyticus TaxID=2932256 RepID=A0ABY4ESY6_9BACI|nr:type II secretion system protein [Gracilibacillus caseinilyticus]UOQ47460.1 type II secretion system GspH family protein [Gracilibacillus caseinilyticus]